MRRGCAANRHLLIARPSARVGSWRLPRRTPIAPRSSDTLRLPCPPPHTRRGARRGRARGGGCGSSALARRHSVGADGRKDLVGARAGEDAALARTHCTRATHQVRSPPGAKPVRGDRSAGMGLGRGELPTSRLSGSDRRGAIPTFCRVTRRQSVRSAGLSRSHLGVWRSGTDTTTDTLHGGEGPCGNGSGHLCQALEFDRSWFQPRKRARWPRVETVNADVADFRASGARRPPSEGRQAPKRAHGRAPSAGA